MVTGEWDAKLTPLIFSPMDTVEVTDEGDVELDITDLAWGWVGGTVENNGISIKASVERGKFGYIDFEGDSGSTDHGPFCIIEYTRPPPSNRGSAERIRSRE